MEKLRFTIILFSVAFVVCGIVFLLTSCSAGAGGRQTVGFDEDAAAVEEQYRSLYESGFSVEELVSAVVGFEADNPGHFESKLDLGEWYFSQGDYLLSWQYLQRALSLADSSVSEESAQTGKSSAKTGTPATSRIADVAGREQLFRLLAYLCLFRDDVEEAETFAERALKEAASLGEGNHEVPAAYLMGQVLYAAAEMMGFADGDVERRALEHFDRAYGMDSGMISSLHVSGYANLLARSGRLSEAESVLETHLAGGNWNGETGGLAEQIYAATGNANKSRLCGFLAQDYRSGFVSVQDAVAAGYRSEASAPWLADYGEGVTAAETGGALSDGRAEAGFFAEIYCEAAVKLAAGRTSREDLESLLSVEPYFMGFPSYYWLVWRLADEVLEAAERETFVSALKKTIALNPEGIYASAARGEIVRLVDGTDNLAGTTAGSLLDRVLF